MKYIIRLLAAIPMLCAGLSFVLVLVLAFDYPILSLLAIGNFWAFIYLSHLYEYTVDKLCDFIYELIDKTPIYG